MNWTGFSLMLYTVSSSLVQNGDIQIIRRLYQTAAVSKTDARHLQKLVLQVDSDSAPLLFCYKGANEMIQAKYALNPIVKLDKFSHGKFWITASVNRDTLNVEMRFIRYSIQSNLPAFLGYHENIDSDKKFLLLHTKDCNDIELKKMIVNYLAASGTLTQSELKGLSN